MPDKTKLISARLPLILLAIFAGLCLVALVRVELLLREQRVLISNLQEKTDCLVPCRLKTNNDKETSKTKQNESKSRSRRDLNQSTPNINMNQSQDLQELYSSIAKLYANRRPGPPGPPGKMGPSCKSAVLSYPPKISLPVGPIYVEEGDNVTLPCHVTGSPTPIVTWSKVMSSLPPKRSFINANKLKVMSIQEQDSGLYVCTGSNSLGSTIGSIKIIVVLPPKFLTTPPRKITRYPNNKLALDCQASGNPLPVISWSKENGQLPMDRTQLNNGRLIITGLKTSDTGNYVCTAVSAGIATSKSVAKLMVTSKGMIQAKVDMKFVRASVSDYIVVKRKLPPLTNFTMCLWMKSSHSTGERTMISYAVPGTDNEIALSRPHALALDLGGEYWETKVSVTDGNWHHICVTWDNTAGQSAIYKDGVRSAMRKIKKGHVTKGGGSMIIGQDQDNVGGGFAKHQSFIGSLTGINMWNRVLGAREILKRSKSCESSSSGNVLTMNDVISGTKHGQVQIIKPSACKP